MLLVIKECLIKTHLTCMSLFKILVPFTLILKIITELNILFYFTKPLSFMMHWFNIPDIYLLVWLSTIVNTTYAAIPLLLEYMDTYPITLMQVNIIAMLSLMFHSVFIEYFVLKKLQVNAFLITILRFLLGLISAFIIYFVYTQLNWGQELAKPKILFLADDGYLLNKTFMSMLIENTLSLNFHLWLYDFFLWMLLQLKMLITIVTIVFSIFMLVFLMEKYNVFFFINTLFRPFFRLIGLIEKNYKCTVVCSFCGLLYGWGILKFEFDHNIFYKRKQLFISLLFIAICHSLIEDSLIFVIFGAGMLLLVVGRFLLSICFIFIFVRLIYPFLPDKVKQIILNSNGANKNVRYQIN